MSNYSGGRKAPNVSQYIADLNTIPSTQDLALQDNFTGLEDDLALFTNTEFFDLDLGTMAGMSSRHSEFDPAADDGMNGPQTSSYETSPSSASYAKPDFRFPDFGFQPNLSEPSQLDIKAAHAGPLNHASPVLSPTSRSHGPQSGDKRKGDYLADPNNAVMEEASRMAAEEDKRRRNTAASARFRIKKKQREQALEKTAKEMTDKVGHLENRVQQLEMENKWLRNIVTEKSDKTDISDMFKQFAQQTEKASKEEEDRKDGVGTSM